MNNLLLIILALVFVAILFAINIYILKIYEHADDKGFFNAFYCKIFIILGSTLFQAQALLVPLDVANQSALIPGGIDMKSFWYFAQLSVLVCACFLLPFALFFYETDGQDGIVKRFLQSLIYTIIANISVLLLLFISYNFLKYAELPVHTISSDLSSDPASLTIADFNAWQPVQTEADSTFEIETSFAVYVIAITSFFGWILVVIFAGVGLFALPIDMINQFRFRPKARRSKQMKDIKVNLVRAIKSLSNTGDEIKQEDQNIKANEQGGFFEQWRGKRSIQSKITQFKAKYFIVQEQFQIFQMELKFSETNPIIPILRLIIGIIFAITSILWIIQIILGNIAKSLLNRPLIPFLNELLIKLDDANAGFLATGIYFYLCIYIIWCVQKGTVKFGMRIPGCCRFHPMKQGQTWMNSFIFNVILMLIASVGVIQLCISSFPTYTRHTEIYTVVNLQLNYMKFYSIFYQNNVFPIALVIWSGLTFIFMLVTCNKKPQYMQDLERIRNHEDTEHDLQD